MPDMKTVLANPGLKKIIDGINSANAAFQNNLNKALQSKESTFKFDGERFNKTLLKIGQIVEDLTQLGTKVLHTTTRAAVQPTQEFEIPKPK